MTRMVSPDRGCVQVDVGRTRYSGRIVDASPGDAKLLREAGYFPASLGGVTKAVGFVCPDCGFRSHFRRCSRCQGECVRPTH